MKVAPRFYQVLAGILLVAHLTLLGFFPLSSEDTWWHLKEGELYVSTHSLPTQDPFAFTTQGRQWIKYSWLADIAFYLVFRACGLPGLVLLRLILLLLIALVLYRMFRASGLHPHVAILLVYLASLSLRFRLLIRPELLAFLFLLAALAILLRLQTGPPWLAYALLPVFVVWVNVHGSFVFGIALPGLVLLANLVRWNVLAPGWDRLLLDRTRTFHLGAAVAALPVAGLLNPHGAAMLLFPFQQNQMVRLSTFTEWMGIWHLPSIGPKWWEIIIALGVVTLAFVATAVLLFARERRVDPVGWGIVLSMGTYAVFRNRAVPFFILAVLPLLACALMQAAGRVLAKDSAKSPQRLERLGAMACLLVLTASLLDQGFLSSRFSMGFGLRRNFFPEGAASYLERNHLDGRIFNTYHFGGYLIWRRWPANQVFIDGRYDAILFDQALYEDYIQAHRSPAVLDRLSATYGMEILVLDATEGIRMRYIHQHPGWALVYWDPVSEVFVWRGGRYAGFIPTHEYKLTRSDLTLGYLVAYRADPAIWGRALAELRRAAEENPENLRAWLGLVQEYAQLGPDGAEKRLQAIDRAVPLMGNAPGIGNLHADRAQTLLNLGRLDEGEAEAQSALRLQGDLLLPRWVLASVAERRGEWERARELLRDLLGRLDPGDPRVQPVQSELAVVEKHLRSQGQQ